jgi:hypothetical protein
MAYYFDFKRFREEQNIPNQMTIATMLECGQTFVSQMERYNAPIPDEMFNRLCDQYGREKIVCYIVKKEEIPNTIHQNNVNGDNIQGHNVTVTKSQTETLLESLRAKDEQLSKSQAHMETLLELLKAKEEQLSKSQAHIDRLMGMIEKIK